MDEITKLIKKWFPKEQWNNALKVARGESSLRPNAINNSNTNGSADYGLFQINSIHLPAIGRQFGYSAQDLLDPEKNIQVAKWVYDRNKGWGPWVAAQKLGIDQVPYTPSITSNKALPKQVLGAKAPEPKTTPYPGETEYVRDMVKKSGGNAKDYLLLYRKAVTSPTWSGQYYQSPGKKSLSDNLFETLGNAFMPKAYAAETGIPASFQNSVNANNWIKQPTPYTVKPGDTLWGLAQQYLGNGNLYNQIQGYSGQPNQLPVGQKLTIPRQNQPIQQPNTSTNKGPVYTPAPTATIPRTTIPIRTGVPTPTKNKPLTLDLSFSPQNRGSATLLR